MAVAFDVSSMTTLVLCGGLGTRLRTVIGDRPKVLAPVAGRPFLHYLLQYLQRQQIRDVVLCTGFGATDIEAYCQDGRAWGLQIRYSREDTPLGTAGAIKQAESYLQSNPFCVLNGDSLVQADISTLIQFHQAKRACMTLCLVEVPSRARFGSVTLVADGAITGFDEKRDQQAGLINAGLYLMERAILQMIPPNLPASLEYDVLPRAVGHGLYGFVSAGPFIDVGTPETYALAQSLLPDWEARRRGMRSLVLLDRDGTINVEKHYLSSPDQVELLPAAAEGIRQMRQLGLIVAVVTNQSALARGYLDQCTLEQIHQRLCALLDEQGASLDAIYVCPHHPDDGCLCRKPAPGLARKAAEQWQVDLSRAFVVGDNACDIQMGQRIGATTILVRTGHGARVIADETVQPDYVVDNLQQAAHLIERLMADQSKHHPRATARREE